MAEPDPMVQLEAAIMARLGATSSAVSTDPDLASLLPGGVYSRNAGGDTYPYLTLSLVRQEDSHTWRRAYRFKFRYNVSVTDAAESIDAASAALERVYDLLQDQDASMTMEDFTCGYSRRQARTGIGPSDRGVNYQRLNDEYVFEVYPKT